MLDLKAILQQYGASEASIKLLDGERDASLLRYVDLFPESAARKGMPGMVMPAGVVEHHDLPLVYLYRADALASDPAMFERTIAELIRALACRGEGDYLAVVHPGQLEVYPIALVNSHLKPERFEATSDIAPLLIPALASGNVPGALRQQAANADSLHELLYELITHVAKALRDGGALSIARERDEVLPLVGRAVFTRFLVDRGIINRKTFPELWDLAGKPERAFDSPELAARTCEWLDDKFNGELLPLLFEIPHPTRQDYLTFFARRKIGQAEVLKQLTHVMYRAPDGRLSLDLSWQGVDFAHVPIGLLSEVYEDYAHEFYRDDALRESVRYTPRHIAEFTIAHAFAGLKEKERHQARVLDPACGAGIFLVLTLQRLVAERWAATDKRPDTREIRSILNTQVRGYDINHSAMTLAALSLYLTALELDPDPFPPEKLRFDRLLGSVLHNMRAPGEEYPYEGLVLGSLGERANPSADEPPFHIVTGNPPWTAFDSWGQLDTTPKYTFNDYTREMVQRIVRDHRQAPNEAHVRELAAGYEHNDKLPDVAFMWRGIEWARPDGVIAFIVAGRLLFKRGDTGIRMRNALFQSIKVTGVLNGALLMPLWKKINQPFCIVFARNTTPKITDRFTLVTPVIDEGPAGKPRMRIDAEARQPIELETVLERPYLFKALTRGGRLDIDIVERIQQLAKPRIAEQPEEGQLSLVPLQAPVLPIVDYWEQWNGGKKRFGQGYIPTGEKTNVQSPKTRVRIAELLRREAMTITSDDLVNAKGDLRIGLRVQPRQVERFAALKLYRLADPDIFNGPMVLINEGFGKSPQAIRARLYLGKAPLVFRRNFYGFSCAGHPRAAQLAKYLFCIINSDLFGYYTLVASAKFGLERRTLLIEDIEEFPILHALDDLQFKAIEKVADELDLDNPSTWRAMNRCINKLYGLSTVDEQVMKDTLETMMPYAGPQSRAQALGGKRELEQFRARVETTLQPLFDPDGQTIEVTRHPLPVQGWIAFDIKLAGAKSSAKDDLMTCIASRLAHEEGASRVFQEVGEGFLRVAVRNQYRYLTPSRARLCAIDVLREHGKVFPITEAA